MKKTRPIIRTPVLSPESLEAMQRREATRRAEFPRKVAIEDAERQRAFEVTPLITPERLFSSPGAIFGERDSLPPWADYATLISTNPHDENDARALHIIIPVGRGHRIVIRGSLLPFATMFEITRFGHSVAVNSNHAQPHPKAYPKFTFRGAEHNNMPVSRPLYGAGPGEAVKAHWHPYDLSPENFYAVADRHARRDAREVTMKHVERLARERRPNAFTVEEYLANLRHLFQLIDEVLGRVPAEAQS